MMVIFMPSIDESSVKYVAYPFDLPVAITETDTMLGPGTSDAPGALLLLIPVEDVNGRHDCLLVQKHHARAFVNGLPVLSATLLHDRDEISLGPLPESRFYFSDEAPPKVLPFHEGSSPVFCARSKVHITEGMPSVQCACGLWYVESAQNPAYTYSETCIGCGRPTSLESAWKPHPVPKKSKFCMDDYRRDVQRRVQDLNSVDDMSAAG